MDPADEDDEDHHSPPFYSTITAGDPLLCCCTSQCPCCGFSADWRRSMKRKLDAVPPPPLLPLDFATVRVEAENEIMALREALVKHQQTIHDLYAELEEERNASSTAASEAMSMILRLQREKAEAQMEARQFKRLAEEKMAHDQQEIIALEDLLFKRDQGIQSLSNDLQTLRYRLNSFDNPQTPTTPLSATAEFPPYPALRCTIPTADFDLNIADDAPSPADLEKYAFGETPRDRIQNFEQRICELERTPSTKVMEKGVVGYFYSPRRPRHLRRMSFESFGSGSFRRGDEFPLSIERAGSENNEEICDRVYTIDAVHACNDSMNTSREFGAGNGRDEGEIEKLYTRLQALEADREYMRQAIMSVSTDKAQMVLLKEIAQQLCKDDMPVEKKIVKKPSFIKSFSIMNAVKWVMSFVCWKKKAVRCRYPLGLASSNAGLLLLLEKSPRMRQRRCLSGIRR
ncbi:myosin-binding protein 7-like isoform X1 [Dioscorea cayenensis subsp. rotundata]|uniref:Myosin-binding protein 7-like isoform X1 n=2 Tax=Dioscorea cayennensis subsp. rotundata TaxID=55577 RepID=A0AB40AI39_DIOCR|nr:myosin-binding protein 7-like isoform X1 [Dioscorea cayenensis subsp. rotundata]